MSIQDDIFDIEDLIDNGTILDKPYKDAIQRIIVWGTENENDNEKLRPIVNGMRNAISLMFEKEEE